MSVRRTELPGAFQYRHTRTSRLPMQDEVPRVAPQARNATWLATLEQNAAYSIHLRILLALVEVNVQGDRRYEVGGAPALAFVDRTGVFHAQLAI